MVRPLSGTTVLDLTRVLAGPFCTMILGDLGASVIKIEQPGVGDDSRGFGPFINGESAYMMSLNRNKRGMTLNLKHPLGKQVFLKMAASADVVVENFTPGTTERLGIDYEVLRSINPRLIYAACSGFGQTGPYSGKPAYDQIVQGMGGIMSITGHPDGLPTRVGSSIGDIVAGLYTAIGVLAALQQRERTGRGQFVDIAMLDCQVAILENAIARYFVTGREPERLGNRHASLSPFCTFETADGYVNAAVGNESLWLKFCDAMGLGELRGDPRFSSNALRTQNWSSLEPVLSKRFRTKTTAEWMAVLEAAGVPCGPINTIGDVVRDPQVLAREMVVEVHHPKAGSMKMAASPVKLSSAPPVVERPAPMLGEHTDEILREFGFSPAEVGRLRLEGAV